MKKKLSSSPSKAVFSFKFFYKPPHGHGLKEIPPRWPRREGETTPACRGGLPWRSLPVWRSPTAKPAAVACRGDPCRSGGHGQACCGGLPCPIPAGLGVTHGQACCGGLPWRSLPVWGSPTAKPAAVACRARSPPVWRSPTAKPAAWVAEIFLGLVALFAVMRN
uniref:Uncharacterized protein n=1 Tax=Fagus sylvatica TaxID=28930 RepID=A0A2N9GFE8_FAGSY